MREPYEPSQSISRRTRSAVALPEELKKALVPSRAVTVGLAVAAAFLGLSCSTNSSPVTTPSPLHVVSFDRIGRPTDPTGNKGCEERRARDTKTFCSEELDRARQDVQYSASRRSRKIADDLYKRQREEIIKEVLKRPRGKRNVLIFVHGGLANRKGSLKRAARLEGRIERESDFYPIFVVWHSSLASSYLDHILFVRQGKYQKNGYVLLAPFYFLTDLLRGVGRAPIVWTSTVKNAYRSRDRSAEGIRSRATAQSLQKNHENFWEGDSDCPKTRLGGAARTARRAVTIPTTEAVIGPVIDALGTSSWKVLVRRTKTLFVRDEAFRGGRQERHVDEEIAALEAIPVPEEIAGGLALFLEDLSVALKEANDGVWDSRHFRTSDDDYWRVTLVGHSMGAIVINHVVRHFGERLPIQNLVYMAAAGTLRDYQETVIPYLNEQEVNEEERKRDNLDRQAVSLPEKPPILKTNVYHITLHRKTEVRETHALGLPPAGSLLVWLDDYLSDPRLTLDRTAGRIRNVLRVADLPGQEGIEDRIHIKAYGAGRCRRASHPQKHGKFSRHYRFWEPQCWEPANMNLDIEDPDADPTDPHRLRCFVQDRRNLFCQAVGVHRLRRTAR